MRVLFKCLIEKCCNPIRNLINGLSDCLAEWQKGLRRCVAQHDDTKVTVDGADVSPHVTARPSLPPPRQTAMPDSMKFITLIAFAMALFLVIFNMLGGTGSGNGDHASRALVYPLIVMCALLASSNVDRKPVESATAPAARGASFPGSSAEHTVSFGH